MEDHQQQSDGTHPILDSQTGNSSHQNLLPEGEVPARRYAVG